MGHKYDSILILLHVAIQFKQHNLLKMMSFSSVVFFWLNYHKSGRCAELSQGLQLHCILFYGNTMFFFITIALLYNLRLGMV